jgi:hypothetical protein
VARIVVLDAWPLGLASAARGNAVRDRCRAWIDNLRWSGVLVIAPEIAEHLEKTITAKDSVLGTQKRG